MKLSISSTILNLLNDVEGTKISGNTIKWGQKNILDIIKLLV